MTRIRTSTCLGRRARLGAAALACLALGACDLFAAKPSDMAPRARPAGLVKPRPDPAPKPPSAASRDLAQYYARVQADLVAQGLLRTDGGGPDTPYTSDMLIRNFERIAFYDEYAPEAGLKASTGAAKALRRWNGPVRISTEFGASVAPEMRKEASAEVAAYAARLARLTGHEIEANARKPNFQVFFLSEDDRAAALPKIRALVPSISPASMQVLRDLERPIHCLVIAFSDDQSSDSYNHAIAIIRAEHPDILRRACIHEELAQGLGLGNDSPAARPSIFNDDDEFAYLTSHDEKLLQLLYDPRLKTGMRVEEARPILRILGREVMGDAL
ncbi:MAG: DUF2927 domain-containing protein [Paracoccaceae bacterium]